MPIIMTDNSEQVVRTLIQKSQFFQTIMRAAIHVLQDKNQVELQCKCFVQLCSKEDRLYRPVDNGFVKKIKS